MFRRRFPPFIRLLTRSIRADPDDVAAVATALFVFLALFKLLGALAETTVAGATLAGATLAGAELAEVAFAALFCALLEAGLEDPNILVILGIAKLDEPAEFDDPDRFDALAPISIHPFEFSPSPIEKRDPTPEPHATPVPTQDARVLYLVAPFVLRLPRLELLEIHRITDSPIHDHYKHVRG